MATKIEDINDKLNLKLEYVYSKKELIKFLNDININVDFNDSNWFNEIYKPTSRSLEEEIFSRFHFLNYFNVLRASNIRSIEVDGETKNLLDDVDEAKKGRVYSESVDNILLKYIDLIKKIISISKSNQNVLDWYHSMLNENFENPYSVSVGEPMAVSYKRPYTYSISINSGDKND